MGTIAKSTITLSSVSDGYSVLLTPSSCVIHADFDGSNPQLSTAQTTICVMCGDEKMAISSVSCSSSSENFGYTVSKNDDSTYSLKFNYVDADVLSGYIDIEITIHRGVKITARFTFSVERESTMLDWIQDWNSNKTKLGDSYVITPKLFVGKKITGDHSSLSDVDGLTGVYIGPDSDNTDGIYGYQAGVDVFHINADGAMVGGWVIKDSGIYSQDGNLRLLSEGTIEAINSEGDSIWKIKNNGDASFAFENVRFYANGDAEFTGEITSSSGAIGGWHIDEGTLSSAYIALDSTNSCIAISRAGLSDLSDVKSIVQRSGGIYLYYEDVDSYGIVGWCPPTRVGDAYATSHIGFSFGSQNIIGGWEFDHSSLWLGTKVNNYNTYTTDGDITIGTNGLRGTSWYINADGTVSFISGYVTFDKTEGKIAGWTLDKDSLYIGTKNDTIGEFTTASGSLTFGSTGIRGYKWRLDNDGSVAFGGGTSKLYADGSGYVANENISWDASGNVSFSDSVKLNWRITTIDENGIYTGTLKAEQITTGTISSSLINADELLSNGDAWALKQDGSGYLASKNVTWDTDGNVVVKGEINAISGAIGDWYIKDGVITSDNTGSASSYIKLDAANKQIKLQTSVSSYSDGGYDYNMNGSFGAILSLDSSQGIIQAKAQNAPSYSTATSYLSSNGIFSNIAAINGLPATSGYTHRGAIVGLGFANVNKNTWAMNEDETIVAGVYGRASNTGTAAAYGGFFYQLKACGLVTSIHYFGDSNDGYQISLNQTTIIGLVNKGNTKTIYLPKNANEGQEVEIIQMGLGVTRIDTNDGTHIYDDDSENEYYDCSVGWVTICKKVKYNINSTTYDIWAVHQYHFN